MRCTFQDNLVNIYGRDPKTGFARNPFDNVGVQYGLNALNEGKISFDQFLDLVDDVGIGRVVGRFLRGVTGTASGAHSARGRVLVLRRVAIEDGLVLVRREYPTAIGPIDLVCRDRDGQVVAIEVKRRGEIDGVEQLGRYIERLHLDSSLGAVRGVFVAQSVKPQAKVLAEARGFKVVEVDYDDLRGMRPDELRLF